MDAIVGLIGRSRLSLKANHFGRRLDKIKAGLRGNEFWYPYHSLQSFAYTLDVLGREARDLLERGAIEETVLDIGCGDGDVAFFFESLGCKVVAIDDPGPNWNAMRGVNVLVQALHSSVEVRSLNIDSQFDFHDERFGLALLLGVLYHLQNPFYVLNKVAEIARYCLLSTRITRFTPDRRCDLRDQPVAYLVDAGELNNDATNYWIFSEAGLRRILKRTGWAVSSFGKAGNTTDSDPVTSAGDERAIAFLESTLFDK